MTLETCGKGALISIITFSLIFILYRTTSNDNYVHIIREKFWIKDEINMNETSETNETIKHILYWTNFFSSEKYPFGSENDIFKKCPVSNCRVTHNKNLLPVEEFDAIIFHPRNMAEEQYELPNKRLPNQVYIFLLFESPNHSPNMYSFNNFYNWTLSYRLDSDIFCPYGKVIPAETNYSLPTIDEIKSRKYKIAWLVSNCQTPSQREFFVNKIKKYIHVDIFGSCGNRTFCQRTDEEQCFNYIEKNYKFYLSFENSVCEDYVTEKLFNMLKKNIIPITYGGAKYNETTPQNSVIDIQLFNSTLSLVEYLTELDMNPNRYLKYFEWKKHFEVNSGFSCLCDLCAKLNEPLETKVYEDIDNWWNGENKNKCTNNILFDKMLIN